MPSLRYCLVLLLMLPCAVPSPAEQTAPKQRLAETLAGIVRAAIPRTYEKSEDWGRQKRITTGVRADGPVWRLKLHRRKREVDHGTWKRYRVTMVNPEKNLTVRVLHLRSLEGGGVGLSLLVDAKLDGWAQMRHYNRGVHLLTLTAEGTSQLQLVVDCEVRGRMTEKGFALEPVVTDAQLHMREFELQRLGEVRGELAEQLGKGLKHLVEERLDGDKLTAKLNRAIDKKRDRLVLGW